MDKCRHCGTELPPTHTGPCPKCGKSGKAYNIIINEKIVLKESVSGILKPKWSSESLALFFGFVAIFLAIVIPGILYLLPFSLGVNYGILVIFILVMGGVLWWKRYNILMLIRKLEDKFGGEKRF